MKWLCLLSLVALVISSVGLADEPGTRLPDDDTYDRQFSGGLNPVDRGEFKFTGTVYDKLRSPLPGIEIQLFIGGLLESTYSTDSVGQYDFKRTIDFSRDETVMLWFIDPTQGLAPKAFVLKESQACTQHQILSPCLPRLQVERTVESTVYLFDRATKAVQIRDRQCL